MTTTDTYDALCAAIDDGDDGALPILADWLEEQGDGRAICVRRIAAEQKSPVTVTYGTLRGIQTVYHTVYHWRYRQLRVNESYRTFVGDYGPRVCEYFDRKQPQNWEAKYNTRSAAFLALAEALLESTHA